MSGDFRAMMEDAEMRFGVIDEPEPEELETGNGLVVTVNGERRDYHAVAFDEVGGAPMVLCFDWQTINEERVREMAEEHGVELDEQTEAELGAMVGEMVCILSAMYPVGSVTGVQMGDAMTEVFGG